MRPLGNVERSATERGRATVKPQSSLDRTTDIDTS